VSWGGRSLSAPIKYKIYTLDEDGKLRFKKKGNGLFYVPEVNKSVVDIGDHITLDLGDTQIFIELASFKAVCAAFMNKKETKKNIVQLKVVNGGKT